MFGDMKLNKRGWKLKSFEELTYLITDGEHATPKRTDKGIYLLSARNILNHSLQLKDVDYINEKEYDRIAKRIIPQEGDILISCSGTVGRCCSVPSGFHFQMVRSVALIRFKEYINPIFAEYMITSDYLQEQINSSKTVSSQANLFQGKIRTLKGFVPPIEMQNEFSVFVHKIDKSKYYNFTSYKYCVVANLIRQDLVSIPIDDKITDRYYQKEAIRAVCDQIEQGFRKHLLVMATGTGKTRTASSLTDVLSRGKYVTNILFLADRTALVKQAKDDFKNYLPDMSLCNLCSNKDDRNARIVFSTYPTMLNAIDDTKTKDGARLFTPAHFDLIIIDESHRSIFKKYRVIFEYFDALMVGLTATPKTDVDRNTYDFFEMEHGVPTYAYDYETAVGQDHVLVPYYNYEIKTKFLDDGIHYDELSQEDKERYEEDFAIDGILPDFVSSTKMNKFVFNEKTVDGVLQDLMGHGIHVAGGDRLGKTIIFAQNKKHAEYIIKRFNALYPKVYIKHPGDFAQRVICDDSYSQTIIDDFKNPEKPPYIAVSVDMMDTGIDVPECVNLVFFKKVRSKAKFWQMIGRGTRLCKGLNCIDQIEGEYTDKRRFLIFDYCNNFEFFRAHKEGYETKETKSLSENIFGKRIKIAAILQETAYAAEDYQSWREELTTACRKETEELDMQLVAVKLNGQYVRKYIKDEAFRNITESDKGELLKYIAPLVKNLEKEEYAKRFDNFMYGLIYADMEALQEFERAKNQLCDIAGALETKISIPQIKEKIELIREINTKEFWEKNDIILFEKVRRELRGLLKFLDNKTGKGKPIITKLTDPVLERTEGNQLDGAYDFENYRDKVNRYVNEHGNTLAIHKLTHNIPLSSGDYQELERVFTIELGSREDYQREFGDTPFGLLIRKIARLDHEAVMEAFSAFINDESLNMRQILCESTGACQQAVPWLGDLAWRGY